MAVKLIWRLKVEVVVAKNVAVPGHQCRVAVEETSDLLAATAAPYGVYLSDLDHNASGAVHFAFKTIGRLAVLIRTLKLCAIFEHEGVAV